MKIQITKEAFGPFQIRATKEIDLAAKREDGVTNRDHYLSLGALQEMERQPSSKAEKLFWTTPHPKEAGKMVRGQFNRGKDIPATPEAAAQIKAVLEAEGYSDVVLSIREVSSNEPAWKQRSKVMLDLMNDGVMPIEVLLAQLAKLAATTGVELNDIKSYLKLA